MMLLLIEFTAWAAGISVIVYASMKGHGDAVFVLLGLIVPLATSRGVNFIMKNFKRKVQAQLNVSFGQNVVKIASAIMDYFHFPLVLLLSVILTLFLFTYGIIAVVYFAVLYSQ